MKKVLKKIKRFLFDLAPDCRHSVRLQSRSMEADLSWREYLGLKLHLFLCAWCRSYGRQIAFLRAAARRLEEKSPLLPSAKLPADARERIKRSLSGG